MRYDSEETGGGIIDKIKEKILTVEALVKKVLKNYNL